MLDIRTVTSPTLDENCYIINYNDKIIIIDTSISVEELKKYKVNKVDYILLTHAHFDHILTLNEIEHKYNSYIYCSKQAIDKIYDDSHNLSKYFGKSLKIDIDKSKINYTNNIKINDLEIDVLNTPGHSNCSVCYVIKSEKIVFTGDTLFKKSVGRSDLYSGNAFDLNKSLKLLSTLDKDYTIYPGHGEISSIEFEIKQNPYLKSLK